MRVFFNVIVIQIILSTYVLWRGWNALPKNKVIRLPFLSIFVFEILVYLVGYLAFDHLPLDIMHNIAWLGTSWAILIGILALFLLAYDIFRFIDKKKKIFPKSLDLGKSKIRLSYYGASLLIALSIMFYGNYKFRNPEITELNLTIDKPAPNDIKELKIVVVSDIHVGVLIDRPILKKYVDLIMAQKPDIILIVGDIIDYDLASVEIQGMEQEFQRLRAPYGVFASTGNHDYIALKNEKRGAKVDWIDQKTGLTLLRDEALLVDSSFYIVGREDESTLNRRKDLPEIMEGVDKNLPIIVINHEPHRLHEESDNGADIALYGHTHNGQIFPYNYVLKMHYELPYGYKKKDNTHMYVSSGLGLAGPQYRIGTKSEIVVLNIKFAE